MRVIYKSKNYDEIPKTRLKRYVSYRAAAEHDEFYFCEVDQNDREYDVLQGYVRTCEIPPEIAKTARERAGMTPSYIEWKNYDRP